MKLKKINGNKVPLTKENLLLRVDEEDLFHKYLGVKPGSKSYCNPLRKDEHPTCSFYISDKNGRLMFHDFAMGTSWDCFAVIMQKYNLSFWQALEKVNSDFHLRLGTYDPVPAIKAKETKELKAIKKDKPEFTWTEREFSQEDLKYWSSQGVTKKQLNKYHVKCIEKVYLNGTLMAISTKKNPIYGYYYPDTGHIKFYRPLTPIRSDKWFGDATSEDINGYEQLPWFGELLIITKSMKDVMALDALGYVAIAPQGESNKIEHSSKVLSIIGFYEEVFLLYDNDKAGRENRDRITQELDIPWIEIPENYKTKDVAETINKWKKKRTKKLLKQLLSM